MICFHDMMSTCLEITPANLNFPIFLLLYSQTKKQTKIYHETYTG